MKQRYVKRPCENQSDIDFFIEKGHPQTIAEALSARGVTSANYDEFFGDKLSFHNPFDMLNMREAVETISYVMETGGSILIYGDYDADGLTASSILSLYFTDNGVDNDVVIPTRDDGYGLHANLVFEAFEKKFYDLIVTVDCGISNAEEIEKIVDSLGVEVIVSDHHELPQTLPNCLCVNPKMGNYPFANLAGAGVAWKIVEALAGREVASRYADLATIGTIGDLMPLENENRSLVKLGLANFNHKSLLKLAELSHCSQKITCSDVSMKIAPKINAAGRVGSPDKALALLLSRDKSDVARATVLMDLNEQRKQITDSIIYQAENMCSAKLALQEKMVFLYSDSWQHGLLGIVAARFKEKYNVPALVMARDGDKYVGSARGIDGIDLFEAFVCCKDLLLQFGGHKASVGFSVSVDNLQAFREAISAVFCSLPHSCFEKVTYYDVQLDETCTDLDIYKLSEAMQPLLPQQKIVCRVTDYVKFANTFGKESNHLTVTTASGLESKGFFSYADFAPFIKKGANVDFLCSLDYDNYSKKITGIIEDFSLQNSVCFDDFYKLNFLKNFTVCQDPTISLDDVKKAIAKNSVLLIFDDYETYLKYEDLLNLDDFVLDIFIEGSAASKKIVVSPLESYPFDKFENVVVFSNGKLRRKFTDNAQYFDAECANNTLYQLDLTRDVCLSVFSSLKRKSKFDSVKAVYEKNLLGKISYHQFVVALRVFEQLGLVKIIDKFTISIDSALKTNLENSSIYSCFAK